jgi:hypothetical protein
VVDARRWSALPKFRAGDHRSPETRTVRGLAALAAHARCDLLVFSRDADRLVLDRVEDVERAIAEINDVRVVGAVAVRTLDAWVLALLGHAGSEDVRRPKEQLAARGHVTREDRVAVVEASDLAAVPGDARSLRGWLDRARLHLQT